MLPSSEYGSIEILPVTLNWTLSEKFNAIPNPNPNPNPNHNPNPNPIPNLNTKKHYLQHQNLHIGKQIRWAGGGGKEGLYSREATEDILNGILNALIAENL